MQSDRITPNWCPVCEHGAEGHCDERCETREANGQPGHFKARGVVSMFGRPVVTFYGDRAFDEHNAGQLERGESRFLYIDGRLSSSRMATASSAIPFDPTMPVTGEAI